VYSGRRDGWDDTAAHHIVHVGGDSDRVVSVARHVVHQNGASQHASDGDGPSDLNFSQLTAVES